VPPEARPGLISALATIRAGAGTLMVAKLDRLSRSLLDFAGLMERSRREGWGLVALDLGVDTSTPQGEMMANVMATFAQFERRLIGQRTRDALAVKRAQGSRLGRPVELAQATRRRVVGLRAAGMTMDGVAALLVGEGVPTARGGRWARGTVHAVLRSVALDA
jgi:DNA invertase Pin-like site-specific DNA recombinase